VSDRSPEAAAMESYAVLGRRSRRLGAAAVEISMR
jgi:hypothetical protein